MSMANLNLATCYLTAGQPNKALALLDEFKEYARERVDFQLTYGKALFATGRYDAASIALKKYLSSVPNDSETLGLINRLNAIKTIIFQFANFNINRQQVNSVSQPASTTLWGDAVALTFSSNTSSLYGIDSVGYIRPSKTLTNPLSSRVASFKSFSIDRSGNQAVISVKDSNNNYSLYHLVMQDDDSWSVNTFPFSDSLSNDREPSLSADGQSLFFSSNRKRGLGGYDIWQSSQTDGQWSKPINVGPDVNTENDERWPFSHASNDLYFSSNGHPGYGGMDIYSVKPLGNATSWSRAPILVCLE